MATVTNRQSAADIPPVYTVTFANTWAANDSVSIKVGHKTHTMTVGSASLATIASAFRNSLRGQRRNDGLEESTYDGYSNNFGGYQFGEFAEFVDIDSEDTSEVVTLTGMPGIPSYDAADGTSTPEPTVTVTTAGSGTATLATVQEPSGKCWWDNGDNWAGGTAPADDDSVVLLDSDIDFCYGLPTALKTAAVTQHSTYTGKIGLMPVNRNVNGKPYQEYRTRTITFDGATTGASNLEFGLGAGSGSPYINLLLSTTTDGHNITIHGTGAQQQTGMYALNISADAGSADIDARINAGSVALGNDGVTSAFNSLSIGTNSSSRQQPVVFIGENVSWRPSPVVNVQSGLVWFVNNDIANTPDINTYGGRVELISGTVSGVLGFEVNDLNVFGGTVIPRLPLTILGDLYIGGTKGEAVATLDLSEASDAMTVVGASTIDIGGRLIDPNNRSTTEAFKSVVGLSA